MAYLKKTALFCLVLSIALIFFSIFYNRNILTGHNFSKKLETFISAGKEKGYLNIAEFEGDKWDEIIVWFPYESIKGYNIKFPIFLNINVSNSDDSANTIIFLRNNRIIGWAVFDRAKVDFNYLQIGTNRIPKRKAQFSFGKEPQFTKAFLIN